MPRIEQRIIGTSLYMYRTAQDAYQGSQRGGGSGVLVAQPCEFSESKMHLYAVTNAHVVDDGGVVARASTRSGGTKVFDQSPVDWQVHSGRDDVAVSWLGTVPTDEDQELHWVPRAWLASEADLGLVAQRTDRPWASGPVVAGEETFSVARFIGYDGVELNQPIVRFGNLSSPSVIPIAQPFPRRREQESLLVEARSLAGYSGAPVFAYRTETYFDGGVPPVDTALLLGIGWGHLKHPKDENDEYDVGVEKPGQPTPNRYNAGIMAVVPAWKLADLLDDPKVAAARRKYEEDAAN